jgi:catechol 1,2-dioxygenase
VIATAEGHDPVTTHVFIEGSPYLEDDTVFGVRRSLVRAVRTDDDGQRVVDFDIVLAPSS